MLVKSLQHSVRIHARSQFSASTARRPRVTVEQLLYVISNRLDRDHFGLICALGFVIERTCFGSPQRRLSYFCCAVERIEVPADVEVVTDIVLVRLGPFVSRCVKYICIRLSNIVLILILTLGMRPGCLVSDLDVVAGGELLGASAIGVVVLLAHQSWAPSVPSSAAVNGSAMTRS